MFDLKSKLLAAGLVTEAQVQRVESQASQKKRRDSSTRQNLSRPGAILSSSGLTRGSNPTVQKIGGPRVKPEDDKVGWHNSQAWDDNFAAKERERQVLLLKSLKKGEQYELIRRWVSRNRVDKEGAALPVDAEKYFFEKSDGIVTWLTVGKATIEQINNGTVAVMAFMSNSGLSHCVIAREIAEDVAQVFPDWIRVLINKENIES